MKLPRVALVPVLLALVAAPILGGCGSSEEASGDGLSPERKARELLNDFWTAVKDADTATLRDALSPSWQLARADGTNLDQSTYIKEVGSGQIDIVNFTFDDIVATRSGDSITVRYTTTADYTLEGKKYKGAPAPYLGTFVWQDDRWQMTSQANFNVPVD